ncbi:hypothetical protein KFE96_18010 [Kordiimonas sp. SCSIO 12603]|uniref:hypothetical protein n=1 Tax=Kordiimonas sp. SCSIO 12603 TaxID=2829596 RepID=UPI002107FF96|nr:hypothetical protein [Kordiimonas sp. SCSIO 12603]UTW58687.1 hypothetical protein KFE96_18010 [Kordiimonas sp. SCSIO 12603]
MILESRSIIFSNDELFLALRPLLEGRGVSEDISVTDIESSLDAEGEVFVRIHQADSGEPMEFTSKEVGSAVLNHCIDQGIPLPRGSYKELAIRGDMIALIVRLETGGTSSDVEEGEE